MLLIYPMGTPTRLDRALAETVKALGKDLPGVQVRAMEDLGGSWSRAFGVAASALAHGATRLVDAYGRLAMRHDGPLTSESLAATLTERLVQSPPLRRKLFAISTTTRKNAPNFYFDLAPGRRVGLRHLRQQSVIIGFAQPWSVPCHVALRQLQRLHEQAEAGRPIVVGVIAEGDVRTLDKLREQHGLSFAIVPDAHRNIARAYEINAWPTIVAIDPLGGVRTRVGVDRGAVLSLLDSPSGGKVEQSGQVVRS